MKALDTNVLARFFVDDPEDAQAARQRPAAVAALSERCFVSVTVLLELEWVLRGFYELPAKDTSRVLRALAGIRHVTLEDRDAVLAAIDASDKGLDFADALHWARSARRNRQRRHAAFALMRGPQQQMPKPSPPCWCSPSRACASPVPSPRRRTRCGGCCCGPVSKTMAARLLLRPPIPGPSRLPLQRGVCGIGADPVPRKGARPPPDPLAYFATLRPASTPMDTGEYGGRKVVVQLGFQCAAGRPSMMDLCSSAQLTLPSSRTHTIGPSGHRRWSAAVAVQRRAGRPPGRRR